MSKICTNFTSNNKIQKVMIVEKTNSGEILIINQKLGYLIKTRQVTIDLIKEYINWCENGKQTHLISFESGFETWCFVGMSEKDHTLFNSITDRIKSDEVFGSYDIDEYLDTDETTDEAFKFFSNIDIFDSVEFNTSVNIDNNIITFIAEDPNDDDNYSEIEISFEDFKKIF